MRPVAVHALPLALVAAVLVGLAVTVYLVWIGWTSIAAEVPATGAATDRRAWYVFLAVSAAAALAVHLARRLGARARARHDDEPALWI